MKKIIKETTEKLSNGTITKDEADKILLDLFDVNCSKTDVDVKNLTWFQMLIGSFKGRRY